MIGPRRFLRVFAIQRVLLRHGFDEMVFSTPLLSSVSFLLYLLPWNWKRRDYKPRAERIRAVLEDLGPLFVKFGQILSTRRDLLTDDIAEELAKLQDHVPPFPGSEARSMVEKALGGSVDTVFGAFDEVPLASASIAQVHAARLLNGTEVIVKVVRPNLRKTIEQDISLMYLIADIAERYWEKGKQLRPTIVVAEFEKNAPRRTRHDARGGKRLSVETEFRRFAHDARPGSVLGLHPPERFGYGARVGSEYRRSRGFCWKPGSI